MQFVFIDFEMMSINVKLDGILKCVLIFGYFREKDRNKDKDKEFDIGRVKVKEEPIDGKFEEGELSLSLNLFFRSQEVSSLMGNKCRFTFLVYLVDFFYAWLQEALYIFLLRVLWRVKIT